MQASSKGLVHESPLPSTTPLRFGYDVPHGGEAKKLAPSGNIRWALSNPYSAGSASGGGKSPNPSLNKRPSHLGRAGGKAPRCAQRSVQKEKTGRAFQVFLAFYRDGFYNRVRIQVGFLSICNSVGNYWFRKVLQLRVRFYKIKVLAQKRSIY
jgi:hypothetical protein